MSKFKSDNGIQLTQGLFFEFNNPDAPFSFRMDDHGARSGKTYPSMYRMYMECADEYDAAMSILGSYTHWEKLCELDWFMNGLQLNQGTTLPGLKVWREHMKLRDESLAKKQLLKEAENGSVTAQKIIFDASRGKPKVQKKNASGSVTGASAKVSDLTSRFKKVQND